MTTETAKLDWPEVRGLDPASTVAWASRPILPVLRDELPLPLTDSGSMPAARIHTVVVVGGGTLIDRAKLWRHRHSPATRLIAVPSLWGSGAEASPVAVESVAGRKVASMGVHLLPDARAVLPLLADLVPPRAARHGFGDVWAHALEAWLSPLADDRLRSDAASFVRADLLPAALTPHPGWFELSSRACTLQARAGVGLVHGAAHELEPLLAQEDAQVLPGGGGHAHLCSLLLWPVMRWNAERSPRVQALLGADAPAILARLRELHDPVEFEALATVMARAWPAILRNPITRTNAVLVRADTLERLRELAHEQAA
ncbi:MULTISPECIES: iron-containing alcohol dehydrogenase [Ramlibacter]|uniref:Iron-containing alcohol dehydrogenase n=1 Tax=Ramlibacter pinisoli TaxID=2682844 RepID=A0A6N8J213_9BURK|nr:MULTISPECIES: iron-containing alcohol dehydrogenase [Ramlibacter]MBA2962922.1 iron-containing alcohol dehydrogenase [Ramlibacter sp. CGMCC 1.13660]MVQ32865.1 iron-containing alcohol dehydrogenase [Ramlibacter pinisoli]